MYNIRFLLLMLSLLSIGQSFAQLPAIIRKEVDLSAFRISEALTNRQPSFTTRRQSGLQKRARVRRVGNGQKGEPALPDNTPNPKPVAVTDDPIGGSVRRRKLRLRDRS